ncbi:hypothetical protein JHK82_034599 [Glycine max]|nr:hypothetical protein JHK85_035317 [Glycine max]KAG4986980.1 hypothetical protein JHK86_034671 [Glycine max]KAG5120179.1 hypothetical protein JHK82_034599 [Glycine max]KAG5141165.1 hypothetical protein JHK84_034933 [Glycine max]
MIAVIYKGIQLDWHCRMKNDVHEGNAEVLWITCWEDFIHLKKEVGDLDLCLPKESYRKTNEISSEIGSIARENIQKLISSCYPHLKENVLHCLRKNNFPFNALKEEGDSKIWHVTYMGSLSSRRYLGQVFPQHVSEISIKEDESPKKNKPKEKDSNKKDKKKSKSSGSKDKNKNTSMAITIIVTILVAALLFLCCGSGRVRQNDERPLLSMSMNDYSVGSSSNNNPYKNSMKEEKIGFQSSSNTLVDDRKNSMMETQLAGVAASAATRPSFELKPPPGRVANNGVLPLKPPPGRPDLLPHESCSIKPFDNSIVPPPSPPPPSPPPPPPPTPPKPNSAGPPPPPPPSNGPRAPPPPPLRGKPGPRPSPPPRVGGGPPRTTPPFGSKVAKTQEEVGVNSEGEVNATNKAKLKPFFWDKVQANSDQTMVWNQLKAGSFQFNEEMMETLFCYNTTPVEKSKGQQKKEASSPSASPQYIQIINSKKSQNLSILLKALNVTIEEVSEALLEGNELPTEFLQTLLKMAPTSEEELKLRLFNGNLAQLGPADRFLKALVDIPFAFKRMEALLYMGILQEELTGTRESFAILEVACKTLRSSRLFLKLLEAVLKTGNRMNDGTFRGGAQAFKLDTLLKLSDVKGVDGKTTLLHFVVQEIMRTEGIRAARMAKENHSFSSIKSEDLLEDISYESEDQYRELGLQVVSRLSSELENVKKAAALDADGLIGTTSRLGHGLIKTRDFVNKDLSNIDDDKGFHETVKSFVEKAEADVTSLLEEEKKIMALVKNTGDYFHGDSGKDEGLRLFVIVRDFLVMLDKVCKEIQNGPKKPVAKNVKREASNHSRKSSSSEIHPLPPDIRQRIFPAVVANRRMDGFSSDDESP